MRPWSHSRLGTYDDCPKAYDYQYRQKLPPSRPKEDKQAANRGSEIHEKAEKYLLDELKIYPPELQKVSGHAMLLKRGGAKPEQSFGVRSDWSPCEYEDTEAYFRGILDVVMVDGDTVHVQDWKTGKIYDSHKVQLDTYIAIAAAHFPDAKRFIARCIYIDQGIVSEPISKERDRVIPIRLILDARVKAAEEDTIFPTRAGRACKYCDYAQKYGGPCQFG